MGVSMRMHEDEEVTQIAIFMQYRTPIQSANVID
jgi:hypothetical protein